ncbi:cytochrome aa3-600 quinol oxidase (subunit III) [Candidatus Hydrogenisulfobacillus filiaventi]|uniref:Cytochrome aa3-600 quinol oxidase (Subunit III) n=1 Tax=Candidatus Hydrogenisulfobacillus filiaventi TaxID=2707344 RepID=A0A6F8ZEB3_9FIRM|nr:cytochrome c oxidase subunit 3 [Bacillota bacterium]CAB1128271.1 cytochrome aa3-600 quinol oxidase (subunit III) [Candidatus Hydrogenisulfobacillus filiaventi]
MSQAVRIEEPQSYERLPLEFADYHESLKITGFWFFLATDLLLFASLFATFAVARFDFANGPTPVHLYHLGPLLVETGALLTSSFTMSLALFQARARRLGGTVFWMVVTLALGLLFIGTELHEFGSYLAAGASWSRSAFLSALFVLVGTHGAHVSFGILMAVLLVIQLLRRGLTARTTRKLYTFALYWHFLDLVWIFIFSTVYLGEAAALHMVL